MIGVVWAAASGIGFGISQIANRGVNRTDMAIRATTALVAAMLVAVAAAVLLTGQLGGLSDLSSVGLVWFVAATLVHFLVGWTLFAVSQQRIGPSRSASVLSSNPVVAALIAAVVLGERLRPITWAGVVLVTVGVAVIARSRNGTAHDRAIDLIPILGATLMFSISPVFVTYGLAEGVDPLVGLMVGLAVTVPAMMLTARAMTGALPSVRRGAPPWLLLGGVAAGFAITAQWTAFDLIPIGAVVSLQQISTPVVLFAGPAMLRAAPERPTRIMLAGTALILLGAVIVAMFGREWV